MMTWASWASSKTKGNVYWTFSKPKSKESHLSRRPKSSFVFSFSVKLQKRNFSWIRKSTKTNQALNNNYKLKGELFENSQAKTKSQNNKNIVLKCHTDVKNILWERQPLFHLLICCHIRLQKSSKNGNKSYYKLTCWYFYMNVCQWTEFTLTCCWWLDG